MGTPIRPTMGRDPSKLFDQKKNEPYMLDVRALMPTQVLLGTGKANPMDPQLNDSTMLQVRKQRAPMGSIPGVMPAAPTMERDPMTPMRAETIQRPPPLAQLPETPHPFLQMPPPGSRIGQSQFNRGYAPGSLAGRGATPVGRSMKEAPERRLETAARYGSLRAAEGLVGLKQTGMQRDFQAEQNQMYRDQQEKMFGLEQGAVDARHQQDRTDRFDLWNADAAEKQRQQDEHWQNQVTLFGLNQGADAMKSERERQQQEADRNRKPNVGFIPVPGTDYGIPTADGRSMGTVPMKTPDAGIENMQVPGTNLFTPMLKGKRVPGLPMLEGKRMPQAPQVMGPMLPGAGPERPNYQPPAQLQMKPVPGSAPGAAKPPGKAHIIYGDDKVPHEIVYDESGKVKGFRKLPLLDANGDGIPDAAQGAGVEAGTGAVAKTNNGIKFQRVK